MLAAASRPAAARQAFTRALASLARSAPDDGATLRCRALAGLGRAAVLSGEGETGFEALRRALEVCPDLPAPSLVLLARVAFVRGDRAALEEVLATVNARDATLAAREGLAALPVLVGATGDLAVVARQVRKRLSRWPLKDPVAEEAMDRFAALERRRRFTLAAGVLRPLVDAGYQAPLRKRFGQLEYWLGRAEAAEGRTDAAAAAWERGARRDPLSWYGLLSLAALQEVAPERAVAVRLAAVAPVDPGDADRPETLPEPVPPALAARLRTLAALGLVTGLVAEARALGLQRDAEAAAWVSRLLADAGAARLGSAFAHEALDLLGATTPIEGRGALWRAAYPTPFPELVRPSAERSGVDPLLVWAVMRIESAYDATARSHAGARGLLQLMPGTADWLLDTTAAAGATARAALDLLDPAHNVALGTDMLARLDRRFDGETPLVLAAYNAGPGRVTRWLRKARGGADLVRFVEDIPYDEARDYTRSVVGAWAVYHWLYGCGCLVDLSGLR
jgi:soluble lytic murein transglycosylase